MWTPRSSRARRAPASSRQYHDAKTRMFASQSAAAERSILRRFLIEQGRNQ